MKTNYLPGLDEWDDFDRATKAITQLLGWIETKRIEGPDARVCSFSKNGLQIWLVFDDMMGMDLKCDGDSTHLASVGRELLAILKPSGTLPPT